MLILGIETSCDETSCAVVKDGREVLSCVTASQVEEHRLYGGVVPEIASRRHTECISQICRKAVTQGCGDYSNLDAIAVTSAPGLVGALITGVSFAKGLALSLDLPFAGVHHLRSHIAANYIAHPSLTPPFIALVVSGGHSHIVEVRSFTEFHIIGRTRDDAAGEAFDKVARVLGFPYPGGVFLDKAATEGDPRAYRLPRPEVAGSAFDMSFSGLKTAVINIVHNAQQKEEVVSIPGLAASFTEAVTDILTDRSIASCKMMNYNKLVIAGGVSANSHLRKKLSEQCLSNGIELFVPPLDLCGDNAAMVASQGYFELDAGNRSDYSLNAIASLPIDGNLNA